MGKFGRKVKKLAAVVRRELTGPECEHLVSGLVSAFTFDPISRAIQAGALTAVHVAHARYGGRICSVCYDLKPFDAPLC